MLLDRLRPARLRHVGEIAHVPDAAGERAVQVGERPVPRGAQDALVDFLVDLEIGGPLRARVVEDHLVVEEPDLGDLLVGDVGAGELARHRLEMAHHREHLLDVGDRELRDGGAAVGQEIDQPLRRHHLERLAERRARHAEANAEKLLRHARARRQLAVADHVTETLDQLVMQRASSDGLGRDSRHVSPRKNRSRTVVPRSDDGPSGYASQSAELHSKFI